ncbi:restriction endonuclease subunit S [Neptunomonas phycophila]|uniref:restriction endonuclease subunit S n=1 Tax=Neptunomonas phycophila TaxID=1572645 RepID=UPI00373576A3
MTETYQEYAYSEYFRTALPAHWNIKKLSLIADQTRNGFVDGPFGSDLKSNEYQDSGVPLIQLNNIRDGQHVLRNMKFITQEKKQQLSRHIALPRDVVIAKMADPVARAAIVEKVYDEYVIVADCVKLSPDLSKIDLAFLVWAINSDAVRINAELASTGTTRIRINLAELKKLKIPYPSIIEQQQIANFLDHETARIDTLIDKQQQLIKLLKEKRQAVISHAVTKGLNPNAPMKDSGVEWLGEVPEHWKLMKFNHCASIRNGQVDPRREPYNKYILVAPNHIESKTGKIIFLETSEAQGADSGKYQCKKGEVIYSKIRPALAKVCLSPSDQTICSADMYPISGSKKLINEFLYRFLLSEEFTNFSILESDRVAMPKINRDSLSCIKIPIPPLQEQVEIVKFVTSTLDKLDSLEINQKKAVTLLQERRTALISAAVTGKIDVRNFKAGDTHVA